MCQTCHSVYYDPSSNSVVKVVLVSVVYVCGYVSLFVCQHNDSELFETS